MIKRWHFAFLPSLPLISRPAPTHRHRHRSPISLKAPTTSSKPPSPPPTEPNPIRTALILNSVPFLWATYPTLSFYLTHLPHPLPPNLLTFLVYFTALLPLPLLREPDTTLPYRAGAELGTYLFLGTILLLFSLQQTTAPRAALLVQSTTIFVPVLNYLLGRPVSIRVALGAILAMLGVYVLESATGVVTYGDALALFSALLYSVYAIRLEKFKQPSIPLVEAKTLFQTILSMAFVIITPNGTIDFLQVVPTLPFSEKASLIGGVLWLGLCSTALSTWLQVEGQRLVGSSRAAVFYATQPAWAVGLAYAAGLGTVDVHEIIGMVMIVAAGLLTGME